MSKISVFVFSSFSWSFGTVGRMKTQKLWSSSFFVLKTKTLHNWQKKITEVYGDGSWFVFRTYLRRAG